jgi:hypothetical protein
MMVVLRKCVKLWRNSKPSTSNRYGISITKITRILGGSLTLKKAQAACVVVPLAVMAWVVGSVRIVEATRVPGVKREVDAA